MGNFPSRKIQITTGTTPHFHSEAEDTKPEEENSPWARNFRWSAGRSVAAEDNMAGRRIRRCRWDASRGLHDADVSELVQEMKELREVQKGALRHSQEIARLVGCLEGQQLRYRNAMSKVSALTSDLKSEIEAMTRVLTSTQLSGIEQVIASALSPSPRSKAGSSLSSESSPASRQLSPRRSPSPPSSMRSRQGTPSLVEGGSTLSEELGQRDQPLRTEPSQPDTPGRKLFQKLNRKLRQSLSTPTDVESQKRFQRRLEVSQNRPQCSRQGLEAKGGRNAPSARGRSSLDFLAADQSHTAETSRPKTSRSPVRRVSSARSPPLKRPLTHSAMIPDSSMTPSGEASSAVTQSAKSGVRTSKGNLRRFPPVSRNDQDVHESGSLIALSSGSEGQADLSVGQRGSLRSTSKATENKPSQASKRRSQDTRHKGVEEISTPYVPCRQSRNAKGDLVCQARAQPKPTPAKRPLHFVEKRPSGKKLDDLKSKESHRNNSESMNNIPVMSTETSEIPSARKAGGSCQAKLENALPRKPRFKKNSTINSLPDINKKNTMKTPSDNEMKTSASCSKGKFTSVFNTIPVKIPAERSTKKIKSTIAKSALANESPLNSVHGNHNGHVLEPESYGKSPDEVKQKTLQESPETCKEGNNKTCREVTEEIGTRRVETNAVDGATRSGEILEGTAEEPQEQPKQKKSKKTMSKTMMMSRIVGPTITGQPIVPEPRKKAESFLSLIVSLEKDFGDSNSPSMSPVPFSSANENKTNAPSQFRYTTVEADALHSVKPLQNKMSQFIPLEGKEALKPKVFSLEGNLVKMAPPETPSTVPDSSILFSRCFDGYPSKNLADKFQPAKSSDGNPSIQENHSKHSERDVSYVQMLADMSSVASIPDAARDGKNSVDHELSFPSKGMEKSETDISQTDSETYDVHLDSQVDGSSSCTPVEALVLDHKTDVELPDQSDILVQDSMSGPTCPVPTPTSSEHREPGAPSPVSEQVKEQISPQASPVKKKTRSRYRCQTPISRFKSQLNTLRKDSSLPLGVLEELRKALMSSSHTSVTISLGETGTSDRDVSGTPNRSSTQSSTSRLTSDLKSPPDRQQAKDVHSSSPQVSSRRPRKPVYTSKPVLSSQAALGKIEYDYSVQRKQAAKSRPAPRRLNGRWKATTATVVSKHGQHRVLQVRRKTKGPGSSQDLGAAREDEEETVLVDPLKYTPLKVRKAKEVEDMPSSLSVTALKPRPSSDSSGAQALRGSPSPSPTSVSSHEG